MARKFFTPIDLTGLELQNAKIQNLASDPSEYGAGGFYYNTVHNEIRVYNGSSWIPVGGAVMYGNTASRPAAGNAGNVYADTQAQTLYVDNGSSWIQIGLSNTATTDDLTEGTSNLYYTDTRARNAVSTSNQGLSYDSSTGVFSVDYSTLESQLTSDGFAHTSDIPTTTDSLTEGTTNLYFTTGRVDTELNNTFDIYANGGNTYLGNTFTTDNQLATIGDIGSYSVSINGTPGQIVVTASGEAQTLSLDTNVNIQNDLYIGGNFLTEGTGYNGSIYLGDDSGAIGGAIYSSDSSQFTITSENGYDLYLASYTGVIDTNSATMWTSSVYGEGGSGQLNVGAASGFEIVFDYESTGNIFFYPGSNISQFNGQVIVGGINSTDGDLQVQTAEGLDWFEVQSVTQTAYLAGTLAIYDPTASTFGADINSDSGGVLYISTNTDLDITTGGSAYLNGALIATEPYVTSNTVGSLDGFTGSVTLSTADTSHITVTDNANTVTFDVGTDVTLNDAYQVLTHKEFGTGSSLGADLDATTTTGSDGYTILNLKNPTNQYDAANKAYVDSVASGLMIRDSVDAASSEPLPSATYADGTTDAATGLGIGATLTATANGALSFGGDTNEVNDRLLVKDQADEKQNGVYVITALGDGSNPWILTRSPDMDNSILNQVHYGAAIFVSAGTLAGTLWVLTNEGTGTNEDIKIGTDNVVFSQFAGPGSYSASHGVKLSSNDIQLNPSSTGGLEVDATYVSIKLQTSSGLTTTSDGLAVATGTGVVINGSDEIALDTSNGYGVRKYATSLGDGSSTSYTITHNFSTRDVTVTLYDAATYAEVFADVVHTDANTVTVTFAVAPSSNAYRVVVVG